MIDQVVRAAEILGRTKTGALIVIDRETGLSEYIDSGIKLDALVSAELLVNLFVEKTPLHDGAAIIRQNRVAAAACWLPLAEATPLPHDLGTRHRAAIGITEQSDCVVVVVSEETGVISVAFAARAHPEPRREVAARDADQADGAQQAAGPGAGPLSLGGFVMIRRLLSLLRQDFWLKLLALSVSVLLWAMVVQDYNKVTSVTFDVPLEVISHPEYEVFEGRRDLETEVEVRVTGPNLLVSSLKAEDLRARVDYRTVQQPGRAQEVRVQVTGPPRYEGQVEYRANPSTVTVTLVENRTLMVPVMVTPESGIVAVGDREFRYTAAPVVGTIAVSGRADYLGLVRTAVVALQGSDLQPPLEDGKLAESRSRLQKPVRLVDAVMQPVEKLAEHFAEVEITWEELPPGRRVAVSPQTIGELPPGFELVGVCCRPGRGHHPLGHPGRQPAAGFGGADRTGGSLRPDPELHHGGPAGGPGGHEPGADLCGGHRDDPRGERREGVRRGAHRRAERARGVGGDPEPAHRGGAADGPLHPGAPAGRQCGDGLCRRAGAGSRNPPAAGEGGLPARDRRDGHRSGHGRGHHFPA